MLNFWISSNDEICPDNYNYFGADDQYQEDVGCFGMLNGWFSSIDVICADNHNYFQFKLKGNGRSGAATQVVDVPVFQLHRCCSSVDGLAFLAVYTGTRPGVPPPSGRGRGGGDAGSLLPGVLPPELVAS